MPLIREDSALHDVVKSGRVQTEQMFSGLSLKADAKLLRVRTIIWNASAHLE